MKIEILGYDDLTEGERAEAANNGCGKEMATYMRITYASGVEQTESDAMEPEDAGFHRDLRWVEGAILRAYRQGMEDAEVKAANATTTFTRRVERHDGEYGLPMSVKCACTNGGKKK